MLEPIKHKFIETFDELLESDINLETGPNLVALYSDNPKYQKAVRENRTVLSYDPDFPEEPYLFLKENNLAGLTHCKQYSKMIELKGDGPRSLSGVYLIRDPVFTDFDNLAVDPYCPYVERFQGKFNLRVLGKFGFLG